MRSDSRYDCIVIGAGPGGLVAAMYLQRLKRRVLLIDGGPSRAARIPKIRNLVGYAEGISGTELLDRLHCQLDKCKGEVMKGRATVGRSPRGFDVYVDGRCLQTRKVILGTGMRDIEPDGLTNLDELTHKGLLGYCPICDGFDHSEEKIALLVQSNGGVKKVRFMAGFSRDLVVVQVKPFEIAQVHKPILEQWRIPVVRGPLKAITQHGKGLCIQPEHGKSTFVDAAYVLLGAKVPRDAVRNITELKRSTGGFLVVNAYQETSVEGLYAIGDCVDGLSQVSVAVGQAAIAATHVHNTL
jgi:thioredoxin reductase (NADPH)